MSRSAWNILAEDYGMGFAGRLDWSGNRGGLKRDPQNRGNDFPYDKDDPDQTYGNPQTYDRGSNKSGAMHKPLTPKDISDKDAERMGLKPKFLKLTDEELDEVMGSPMLLGRADSSNMGSSVPGVGSGWAKNPPKDWDDEDFSKFDEAKLDRMIAKLHIRRPDLTRESPLMIDPRPPDIEAIPNQEPEYGLDQSDSDLERRLFLLGIDKGDGLAPGMVGSNLGSRMTSRGLYGMMPKESAWEGLNSMFRSR